MRRSILVAIVLSLVLAACSIDVEDETGSVGGGDVPKGCAAVDIASSPEKLDLLNDLARRFNGSDLAKGDDGKACSFVRVDRKSTRLNSSHLVISYAVFCLKKKRRMKVA